MEANFETQICEIKLEYFDTDFNMNKESPEKVPVDFNDGCEKKENHDDLFKLKKEYDTSTIDMRNLQADEFPAFNSFNQGKMKLEDDVPTFINIFDQLYMRTGDGPTLYSFNHIYMTNEDVDPSDHLYLKTEDSPSLTSVEHDHCYLRGMVKVSKVHVSQKLDSPIVIAKDIFRAPVESFKGMMKRLESREKEDIWKCKEKSLTGSKSSQRKFEELHISLEQVGYWNLLHFITFTLYTNN